jgi:hypothetical protein
MYYFLLAALLLTTFPLIPAEVGLKPSINVLFLNIVCSLKGQSHEIGKACRWFHWIELKYKGLRFMLIFILNVVFTTNFLIKVAPIRVRFSPGFPPGAGFPGEEFAPACF